MSLAEELVKEHGIDRIVGGPKWRVIKCINEAIERCAMVCDHRNQSNLAQELRALKG